MGNVTWKKAPTAAELLAQAKAKQAALIERARDEAISAGFEHNFAGIADIVQTRQRDRENLTGLAVSAQRHGNATFQFRAESNTTYNLTADQMLALADAAQQHVSAQYVKSWERKAEINTAESIEAVQAITW